MYNERTKMSEFLTEQIGFTIVITTNQIVERDIKTAKSEVYQPKMVATVIFGDLESVTDSHIVIKQSAGTRMEVNRQNIVTVAEFNYNKN